MGGETFGCFLGEGRGLTETSLSLRGSDLKKENRGRGGGSKDSDAEESRGIDQQETPWQDSEA